MKQIPKLHVVTSNLEHCTRSYIMTREQDPNKSLITIADCGTNSEKIANIIVNRVNSHTELVKALKEIVSVEREDNAYDAFDVKGILKIAKRALIKAEGRETDETNTS